MDWPEIEVDGQRSAKFPAIMPQSHEHGESHTIGGIIKHGEWAWLASGCTLNIVSLRNGFTVSTFVFTESEGYKDYYIKCVEEVTPGNRERLLMLAVCLDSISSVTSKDTAAPRSLVALYSVEDSCVLDCIEIRFHISCARFLPPSACQRSVLENFDGCLALGTEDGAVLLLNLNIRRVITLHEQRELPGLKFTSCQDVEYSLQLSELLLLFGKCQNDDLHFAVVMEIIDLPSTVLSILPIDFLLGLAVGLEDGRLLLYDITEMQICCSMDNAVQLQRSRQVLSPLVKLDFMVPIDDPRNSLYIWALHESEHKLTAVLHCVMYKRRLLDGDSSCLLDVFINSKMCLLLPLEHQTKSVAFACQSISKVSSKGDGENDNYLCVFGWNAATINKNKIVIFDLNQWYKDEFPSTAKIDSSNFLAAYTLSGQQPALNAYVNPCTITNFESHQRCEEHFYPNSLSFDCRLLLAESYQSYKWEGAQNRVINVLRSSNAAIFLRPEPFFKEILRTHLLPQFTELDVKATFSTEAKYEILLSVALEYNCYNLLCDCARSWGDGSFACNFTTTSTGLSLSTLTDWIWKHAANIKMRCNELCKGVFDFAGYPLDEREQKEFIFLTRQLKLLANLLADVLKFCKRNIRDEVFDDLSSKQKSLHIAVGYQEILSWMINIGLLPEASPHNSKVDANTTLTPYPCTKLRAMYANKRRYFANQSEKYISASIGSCRLIYIDALIEHESNGNILRDYWSESNGDGLYPPTTIEALLRVMLVPDLKYDCKCAILLYFFLDLDTVIDKQTYQNVVANLMNFPRYFKLPTALIRTVQAFWNLDHGNFSIAVDELISPFNTNQNYPSWLVELAAEALLIQKASKLALRILHGCPIDVSPVLKIKILLANELIPEAFHFARAQYDESLLEFFFIESINARHFRIIRDLMLNEKEGQLLQSILKRSNTQCAETLQFIYLLQQSKYIEAACYMDELSKSTSSSQLKSNNDTPDLLLSAFKATMAPVTQGLTDVYFRIRNKITRKEVQNDAPVPFSCQLIQQNANKLLGGIYQSAALSTHFATNYLSVDDAQKQHDDDNQMLSVHNAPFLRQSIEVNHLNGLPKNPITYATPYKPLEKRSVGVESAHLTNPKKKRRLLLGREIFEDCQDMARSKKAKHFHLTDFSFDQTPAVSAQSTTIQAATPERNIERTVKTHSILKTFTPETEQQRHLNRLLPMYDEKSIRFSLPVSAHKNKSSDLLTDAGTIQKEPITVAATAEKEEHKADVTTATFGDTESPIQKRRVLTRTISMDSNSSSSSSDSDIADSSNNKSTLKSLNNSVVDQDNGHATVAQKITPNTQKTIAAPVARKPLISYTVENLKTDKNTEQLPKPDEHAVSQSNLLQSSGGLDVHVGTAPAALFQITSVVSMSSKINDFMPPISSSKVGASHTEFHMESMKSNVKFSERSTIIGGLSYAETTTKTETSKTFACSKATAENVNAATSISKPAYEPHMLDSTLGMSMYECTALDEPASSQQTIAASYAPVVDTTTIEDYSDDASNIASIASEDSQVMSVSINSENSVDSNNSSSSEENVVEDVIVLSSSQEEDQEDDEDEELEVIDDYEAESSSENVDDSSKDKSVTPYSELECSGYDGDLNSSQQFVNQEIVDLSSSANDATNASEPSASVHVINELVYSTEINKNIDIENSRVKIEIPDDVNSNQSNLAADTSLSIENHENIQLLSTQGQFLMPKEAVMQTEYKETGLKSPNVAESVALDESYRTCNNSAEFVSAEQSFATAAIEEQISFEIAECPPDELLQIADEPIKYNEESYTNVLKSVQDGNVASPEICILRNVAESNVSNFEDQPNVVNETLTMPATNVNESKVEELAIVSAVPQILINSSPENSRNDAEVIVDEQQVGSSSGEDYTESNKEAAKVIDDEQQVDCSSGENYTENSKKATKGIVDEKQGVSSSGEKYTESSKRTAKAIVDEKQGGSSSRENYTESTKEAAKAIAGETQPDSSSGEFYTESIKEAVIAVTDETEAASTSDVINTENFRNDAKAKTVAEKKADSKTSVAKSINDETVKTGTQTDIETSTMGDTEVPQIHANKTQETVTKGSNTIADETEISASSESRKEAQVTIAKHPAGEITLSKEIEALMEVAEEDIGPLSIALQRTKSAHNVSELAIDASIYSTPKRRTKTKRGVSEPPKTFGSSIGYDNTKKLSTKSLLSAQSKSKPSKLELRNTQGKRRTLSEESAPSNVLNETMNISSSSPTLMPSELDNEMASCSTPLRSTPNISALSCTTPKSSSNSRGVSLPPQTLDNEVSLMSSRILLRKRATSVQPASMLEEPNSQSSDNPHRMRKTLSHDLNDETSITFSPNSKRVPRNIAKLLNISVTEDTMSSTGSPSSRTRSRTRLNSNDHDLDETIVIGNQTPVKKRIRRISASSVASEPKNRRRNSTSSRTEELAPSTQRAQSVAASSQESELSAVKEKTTQSPIQHEKDTTVTPTELESAAPSTTLSATSEDYSMSRRLTRNQLAMLEKSASSAESRNEPLNTAKSASTSRKLLRRSPNDDDDVESNSSYISSNHSGASKRHFTRSSLKSKDDDVVSIASSTESRTRGKAKASKVATNLTVIAELDDEPSPPPQKRGRKHKN